MKFDLIKRYRIRVQVLRVLNERLSPLARDLLDALAAMPDDTKITPQVTDALRAWRNAGSPR